MSIPHAVQLASFSCRSAVSSRLGRRTVIAVRLQDAHTGSLTVSRGRRVSPVVARPVRLSAWLSAALIDPSPDATGLVGIGTVELRIIGESTRSDLVGGADPSSWSLVLR